MTGPEVTAAMKAEGVPSWLVDLGYAALLDAGYRVVEDMGDQVPEEVAVRRVLAAVLPAARAQALREAATFLATKDLPTSTDGVDVVKWMNATADRLTATTEEPT